MLTVRLDSEVPLTEQIVRGIRNAIATGAVRQGDELPPVRQLANDLGINLNTVARAYRVLEGLGLVHTARGRGTRVVAERESRAEGGSARTERLRRAALDTMADLKLAGLDRGAAERIVTESLAVVWPGEVV
jgi:DNA-binding transcriptional regulator YhcF (GntR family)